MAPIDPADIAAVAATVLVEDGHEKQAYTLTGPEAFMVAEQVAILGTAIAAHSTYARSRPLRRRFDSVVQKGLRPSWRLP
jgi:uncharacterized protein YbjT (DUF2867 family)